MLPIEYFRLIFEIIFGINHLNLNYLYNDNRVRNGLFQNIRAMELGSRTTQPIWWRAPRKEDTVSFTVLLQRRQEVASSR